MLHFRHIPHSIVFTIFLATTILTGCADEHFFPKAHGVFPGLNESRVSPRARQALAEAKVDYMRARRGEQPQYAHFVSQNPKGKRYEGNGYELTMVNNHMMVYSDVGPDIVLSPSITGGQSLHFSDIERQSD
jgi:hypothetical protein